MLISFRSIKLTFLRENSVMGMLFSLISNVLGMVFNILSYLEEDKAAGIVEIVKNFFNDISKTEAAE